MKPILCAFTLAGSLVFPIHVAAQNSVLRIACDGDDVGAEVSVNGKFRGECPLDIEVAPGTIKLRVEKKGDALRERVFEQEIRMGEGTAKKVEVRLATRLTAEGQRQEAARLKADADLVLLREEDAQWQRAQDAANRASMRAYLDKYPNGRYAVQARAKDEEYQRPPPPRPQIPLAVSEDIWKIIEASEAYRNQPKQRPIRVSYNDSTQMVTTAAASAPPRITTYSHTRERLPLGDRCAVVKGTLSLSGRPKPMEFENYDCGFFITLGGTTDGKPQRLIKSLDELKGSLFPMRIGARISIRLQTANVSDSKYDATNASSCEVVSKGEAHDLDSRLAGTAWKVHCQNSYSLRLDNKTKTTESDDYHLENLGVMLSNIGVIDHSKGKAVLPSAGTQTVMIGEGENGYRRTTTYTSYNWTVGD